MTAWNDIKERMLKFDTIHGIYKIPLGLLLIYVAWSNIPYWSAMLEINYSIHDIALFLGLRALCEGLYNFFHNPIKKQAKIDSKAKKYMAPQPPAAS